MKTGLSLTEMARKIEGLAELKHDLIVRTADTKVEIVNEAPSIVAPQGAGVYPILPTTHRQIGTYTKIPAEYYDRMLRDNPLLLTDNINAWFQRFPVEDRRMLRTLGGDARAWLSNSYQRIEHEEIAQAALPVIMNLPQVQIVSCEITDRRLYIHWVVPTIQGEVKVGDVVQAGGILANSETGFGAVSVSGLTWRLRCLNGMKTSDTFRRAHLGAKQDELEQVWKDDTRKADDRAILLKVRDMVTTICDETRFRAHLAKLQGLTEGEITGDPAKAVEVLARKIGTTEAETGGLLRSLIAGGDLSRWGIVNSVTHQAHTAATYDRAVEFEALGGKLVDLPTSEWKEILEAA